MTVTILVVDDNESLRAQMRQTLAQSQLGVTIVEAADGAQALPMALSGDVDIVLSDVVMPNLDGIGLLRGIRQHRPPESLSVILVTSVTEDGTRDLGFEAGANDYLTRPFSPLELVTRVQVQIRLRSLQRELLHANERFSRLSTLDDMTGLPNRGNFLDVCRRELERSRRHELSMGVAAIRIDNLREANQRGGHTAGDAIITQVAELIRRQLRLPDLLAHFSGGTFAVLLPHCGPKDVQAACERLREHIAKQQLAGLAPGEITISIGAAVAAGGEGLSVEDVMNTAQARLDEARGAGGNRLTLASDEEG